MVRTISLIALGMFLTIGLLVGARLVLAQGPLGEAVMPMAEHFAHHRGGAGMMGTGAMEAMHARMHDGETMAEMHARMHDGGEMPEECLEMMDDPAMMGQMMRMMHGGDLMTLEEARELMDEYGIPADVQDQCLEHMQEYHPESVPVE
jgi:hypothetical protein